MNIDRLKSTLRDLHADLETTGNVDPELRELLGQLDGDLHRLLETDTPDPSVTSSIRDRLEFVAADFTAQHPQLGPVLREIADALARIGI